MCGTLLKLYLSSLPLNVVFVSLKTGSLAAQASLKLYEAENELKLLSLLPSPPKHRTKPPGLGLYACQASTLDTQ